MALTIILVGVGWMPPAARAQTTTTPSTAPPATTTKTTTKTTTTLAGNTSTTATEAAPISPALLAMSRAVKRTPPSNTSALLAALAPLRQLGFTPIQAIIFGMGQFPVGGAASYADDWLEYRPGPPAALHPGIDIVAAMGTPLRSPVDGTLTYDTSDPGGYGLAAVVTSPDKTFYRMAHMSATVLGLKTGSVVKTGQVVGFVGSSGNSTGPHCHFEIHPMGGAGVDAKPVLDSWQAAAIKAIPALIRTIKGTTASTAVTVPPLQIALPAPEPAFSPPLAIMRPNPLPAATVPARSVAGLALVALLALLAASGLGLARFRPRPLIAAGTRL